MVFYFEGRAWKQTDQEIYGPEKGEQNEKFMTKEELVIHTGHIVLLA